MFDEMMEVERKGQEGLELDEGFMEVLGLSDLLELEKGDGMEADEGGFLLCPPSSISTSSSSSTQMLSFGGVAQKSSDSSSLSTLSSSPPSTTTTAATSNSNRTSKMSKKVENSGRGGGGRRTEGDATTTANTSKRPKTGVSSSSSTIKVRKEKLGERIMALQQLVSPFGKSDTASVLHEALGYIRFLHDQVQVLSTPYLQRLPHLHDGVVESVGDLSSRGLCLVPISCTEHVADSNGADLWSPSIGSNDWSNSFTH